MVAYTCGRLVDCSNCSDVSFQGHYRRVSVVQFSKDGASLVSIDSTVNVCSMARLLNQSISKLYTKNHHRPLDEELQAEIPMSYCSVTKHTLPVTDVGCGLGAFPSCRVFKASLDHSVRVSL